MSIRLNKEIQKMKRSPIEGFVFDSISEPTYEGAIILKGILKGPEGTSYEFADFPVELKFPSTYPMEPPEFKFLPPIPYHPNVYSGALSGKICISILEKGQWSPIQTIESIVHSVRSLLADVSSSSLANQEAGALVSKNPDLFDKTVRQKIKDNGQYHPPTTASNSESRRKYLKYKEKYLKLKKQLNDDLIFNNWFN